MLSTVKIKFPSLCFTHLNNLNVGTHQVIFVAYCIYMELHTMTKQGDPSHSSMMWLNWILIGYEYFELSCCICRAQPMRWQLQYSNTFHVKVIESIQWKLLSHLNKFSTFVIKETRKETLTVGWSEVHTKRQSFCWWWRIIIPHNLQGLIQQWVITAAASHTTRSAP